MATPELASQAYKRLLDPMTGVAPTDKRIVQDITGVWMAMRIVYDAKGVYVHGLAERSGCRYIRVREPSNGHGGP